MRTAMVANTQSNCGADRSETAIAAPAGGPLDVLILAFYHPPASDSGGARPFRFAKYLTALGHRVRTVAGAGGSAMNIWHGTTLVRQVNAGRGTKVLRHAAAFLQRWALPYNEQLPWVCGAYAAASQLIEEGFQPVLLSTSPPLATHLTAMLLRQRYGLKWVADFRDPLLGNPFRTRRWADPYDRALQSLIFAGADAILSVTDAIAEGWRRDFPKCSDRVHVLWNGYDPEEATPPEPPQPRNRRVLTHVGSLYGARTPRIVLDSVLRLIASGALDPETLKLSFTGNCEPRCLAVDQMPATALAAYGCLEYTDCAIPWREALRQQQDADYLLLIDLNAAGVGHTVPAKLFEYVCAGRPILALTPPDSVVERILCRAGIPFCCIYPSDAPTIVDEKLSAFLRLPAAAFEPSAWFRSTFDGREQAAHLAALLRGVLRS